MEIRILVVEIECDGKIIDAFDKATGSSDGLRPEQVDLNYVHALNEPHLHEICVVLSNHEADQHLSPRGRLDLSLTTAHMGVFVSLCNNQNGVYFAVQQPIRDVIENGNSFNLVPRIIANAVGISTLTISGPVTVKEKAQKKNDVKTRSMLLIALPNEHLLTFIQYMDAKTLFQAIQARFSDLETMSFDDLYNNLKIVEQEVKRIVVSSSSLGSPNMAFLSSPSSTNKVDTASVQVSTASTPLALLSLRERRSPRSQESRPRNQDSSRKTVIVEDASSKAVVAIDGAGFDWSYMGDDEVPTNMALMAFSVSEASKSVYVDTSNVIKKVLHALIIEDWVSDYDEDESEEVKRDLAKREIRPVWNHAMRVNHQNFSNSRRNFALIAVLTKSGIVPISTARQNSLRVTAQVSTARKSVTSNVGKQGSNLVKSSACWVWRPKIKAQDQVSKNSGSYIYKRFNYIDIEGRLKSTIKNMMEDLLLLQEVLKEMCDKKNSVLFTKTECLILSPDFKLSDKNQLLLKVPRKHNMYSFDLKKVVHSKGLTYLSAKATNVKSNLWHRRLGHINFKTMNKVVKGNLVRGLPSKIFKNDHTCVACQKGKQHKASCKSQLVNSISQPLQILHMDLFGPTSIKYNMGKMYCLVVTDDYSRFSWVFFSAKKDETCEIFKVFITGIKNQLNHKVKIIRCDNGTEFKNYEMNQFCGIK
nr:putative ribonuclease H-like domain-containing protein [Tanacetum cinerariifolium]